MKLSTYSFLIEKDGKMVSPEELPKEEWEAYRKKFTEDFMDGIMRAKGYYRKKEQASV